MTDKRSCQGKELYKYTSDSIPRKLCKTLRARTDENGNRKQWHPLRHKLHKQFYIKQQQPEPLTAKPLTEERKPKKRSNILVCPLSDCTYHAQERSSNSCDYALQHHYKRLKTHTKGYYKHADGSCSLYQPGKDISSDE